MSSSSAFLNLAYQDMDHACVKRQYIRNQGLYALGTMIAL